MATFPPSQPHRWYTPADCAALLLGVGRDNAYRAPCPVHGGDSTDCLSIRLGHDKYGNPMTTLHCFAHDCPRAAICAEMGIEVANLYSIRPEHHTYMERFPPARSPRIAKLKAMEEPSPDAIAQILLEEMIVSDPAFLQECAPARAKMWELGQQSPRQKLALTKALEQARLNPFTFWQQLDVAYGGQP